jgi:hypothetical protein
MDIVSLKRYGSFVEVFINRKGFPDLSHRGRLAPAPLVVMIADEHEHQHRDRSASGRRDYRCDVMSDRPGVIRAR